MKLNFYLKKNSYPVLGAFLAGAFLTFAFAPFAIFPIAIFSPAILCALWSNATLKQAFYRGFWFGCGFFATGIYWIFISIHTYGNTSVLLALVITGSFIAFLALFPAVNGYLLNRFFPAPNATKYILAFPALWTLLEWIRSGLFTGFPWLLLGDTQLHSPLKGLAPLGSVYSVTFVTVMTAGWIFWAFCIRQKTEHHVRFYIYLVPFLWLLSILFSVISWTTPIGKPIQVSLIQGNVPQNLVWSDAAIDLALSRYHRLTHENWQSQLIIWPENAVPLTFQDARFFIDPLDDIAKKNHATLIFGLPVKQDKADGYYNALISIGRHYGYYLKRRLVPFGEYTPFAKQLAPYLNRFQIPTSAIVPGKNINRPLEIGNIKIAPFICYEIAYPQTGFQYDDQINLLLTASNDVWFGHSIALAQHLASAQMRSLEVGRGGLFVSNTGITAFINPNGTLLARAPPYTIAVLTEKIQPMTGKTPWQRYGMDPLMIIMVACLLIAYYLRRTI